MLQFTLWIMFFINNVRSCERGRFYRYSIGREQDPKELVAEYRGVHSRGKKFPSSDTFSLTIFA